MSDRHVDCSVRKKTYPQIPCTQDLLPRDVRPYIFVGQLTCCVLGVVTWQNESTARPLLLCGLFPQGVV